MAHAEEPPELQELYNVFGLILTEEQIIPDTSVNDIEPNVFREYMRRKRIDVGLEPRMSFETDLQNREVVSPRGGYSMAPQPGSQRALCRHAPQ